MPSGRLDWPRGIRVHGLSVIASCSVQEGGAEAMEDQSSPQDQSYLWEPVGVICKGWTRAMCQGCLWCALQPKPEARERRRKFLWLCLSFMYIWIFLLNICVSTLGNLVKVISLRLHVCMISFIRWSGQSLTWLARQCPAIQPKLIWLHPMGPLWSPHYNSTWTLKKGLWLGKE